MHGAGNADQKLRTWIVEANHLNAGAGVARGFD